MKIQKLIQQYLNDRESLGWRPCPSGGHLGAFGRFIRADVDISDVRPEQVEAFLKGAGPITLSWHLKYGALQSFYRWAIDRTYVVKSPLPKVVPKHPPAFVPYIYSVDELSRILQAFDEVCRPGFLLDVDGGSKLRRGAAEYYSAGLVMVSV